MEAPEDLPRAVVWLVGVECVRNALLRIQPAIAQRIATDVINIPWLNGFLFAQEDGGGWLEGLGLMPAFVLIFVLLYFMILRPQRKEQQSRGDMLTNLKKNDRVITVGGIYGVVTNVRHDGDEVTIKVDESTNAKLRLTLSSISRVVSAESTPEKSEK